MSSFLDIVIVNWNSGGHLANCLASIQQHRCERSKVVEVRVVDNGSHDGSADVAERDPEIHLLRNSRNLGFAAACNQGARSSQADYLLFLNPDVVLFEGSISAAVEFMESPRAAEVGICGIQLVDEAGAITRSCARFPTPLQLMARSAGLDALFPRLFASHFLSEAEHRRSGRVDQVMGAFLLIRRKLFEDLGGFDERFFVYFEDVDLSLRASQASCYSYYLADARALHVGRGCTDRVKAVRLFYSLRSRLLYAFKHFGWLAAGAITLSTLFVEPVSRLTLAAVHGSSTEIGDVLQGYLSLWRAIPALFLQRTTG